MAREMSSGSSVTVCSSPNANPTDARRRANVEQWVLIFPRRSSLPTQIRLQRVLLDSKISLLHLLITHQCIGGAFQNNLTRFQNIGTLSGLECFVRVLFHHQDRHPLTVNFLND